MKEEIKHTHQQHTGSGDNIQGDKITQIYLQTQDYQLLDNQLKDLETRKQKIAAKMQQYPDDTDFSNDYYKIDADIVAMQQQIESFKAHVTLLYETFSKIEINTERLRLAKMHFETGAFREADAILKATEMSNEVAILKDAKATKENQLTEINKNLADKANEFRIKAELWKTFYAEKDWLERTQEYYEKSLDARFSVDVTWDYAVFLLEHHQVEKAQYYFTEALQFFQTAAKDNPYYLPDVADLLINLAVIHSDKHEIQQATEKYYQALDIYNNLNVSDTTPYLPAVAKLYNNLANIDKKNNDWFSANKKFKGALDTYIMLEELFPGKHHFNIAETLSNWATLQEFLHEYTEALKNHLVALQIFRELSIADPKTYNSHIARTLNNLANFYSGQNDLTAALHNHEEALQIRRELAKDNPSAYLPEVAKSLNNLAFIQAKTNQHSLAIANYEETLQIYNTLAKANPDIYMPNVATVCVDISVFYTELLPDADQAIAFAKEALKILLPIVAAIPYLRKCAVKAIAILKENGVDLEDA